MIREVHPKKLARRVGIHGQSNNPSRSKCQKFRPSPKNFAGLLDAEIRSDGRLEKYHPPNFKRIPGRRLIDNEYTRVTSGKITKSSGLALIESLRNPAAQSDHQIPPSHPKFPLILPHLGKLLTAFPKVLPRRRSLGAMQSWPARRTNPVEFDDEGSWRDPLTLTQNGTKKT